jgi:large subunit ribosomal protein L4|uniref:Large ribosomal subunit protein uL4c n=1 Tax=Thalassiosira tenera TaxID=291031 RepID=A0A8K1YGT2_9STRA|nr:ribosomal protein L4 [Thalassiosira tenera]UBQ35149.1 ribosomal protein L4 [Thalassiosira tenera]
MAIQKTIEYNSLDSNGQTLSDKYNFKLNILENSANYLIHRDILRHQLSQKQGTVSTKTRSEVRGGGKKPWQQKGTGRARAGSSRSPLWKGGGVIFGPKPKVSNLKLNKKERNLALQTLLYNKRNSISVIGELESLVTDSKTKVFCDICKNYNLDLNQKILFVVSKKTIPLKLSTRNLKNVELISASNLNTLSLLKAKKILLTPLAVNDIKEIYCD